MLRITAMLVVLTTLVMGQNWQPVYELFNPSLGDHFYTMNTSEVNQAESSMGYSNHGAKYKWSTSSYGTGVAIYRLWNGSDHFYTTSETERDNCVASGYTNEGVVGYLNPAMSGNLIAWQRYYHSQWDDHAYPVDASDISVLTNAGYLPEGVHGYVLPLTDDEIPNEPPNANWTCELFSTYDYEEISFTWEGLDDNTSTEDIWYHIQLSGNGSFDFWTPNNYLNCWPGIGDHTLIITARDLDDVLDLSPLIHNFSTIGRAPDPPHNLSFSITSDEHLVLHWESEDDIVVGFTIWRDYDTEMANLPAGARDYEDDGVEMGQTYRYTVVAYSHYGWTESEPIYAEMVQNLSSRATQFDYPVGYPDFAADWYDAQNFGSVLADPEKFHSGNDLNRLSGDLGEMIHSPANGVIVYKNNNAAGWGKCMVTKHQAEDGNNFSFPDGSLHENVYFLYAHLENIVNYDNIVINETIVERGEVIATLGNTGSATGPHLHIECWSSMSDGYPLGYGYYNNLPEDKYDVLEFISMNRQVGNSYDMYVHTYNNGFQAQTNGWEIVPGAQEMQYLPLGYNNYLYVANTSQNEVARWSLGAQLAGNYELLIYIPNRHYSSTNAHYVLQRAGFADEDIYVNGSVYSNEWVSVGNFQLESSSNYLILYSYSDEYGEVSADAVHLHYLDDVGGAVTVDNEVSALVKALTCYPNPFNSNVYINYSVPSTQFVNMEVYNILGQRVAVLVDKVVTEGDYVADWQAGNLASGIYLAVLRLKGDTRTIKLNYLR
ncbi:MAG: peptidoglycan DD-metalloendopeptidase family protein [Candidatus Komeilibacteria bacterium]